MLKIILKIYFRILRELKFLKFRLIDLTSFNYLKKSQSKSIYDIDFKRVGRKKYSIINYDFVTLNEHCVSFKDDIQRILNHEFNLLGSGWQNPKYELGVNQKINPNSNENSNTTDDKSSKIKEHISLLLNLDINIVNEYIPIDWHLDFISGFRWNEKSWYMDVPIGKDLGTDIKVPWELSRLQHLPQLALSYSQDSSKEYLAKECVLQITDWIVSNRLRFGVNWRTSMEVGIRACNMLLTYELIKESNSVTQEFNELFEKSLHEHGSHIKNNLETSYFFPGHNHYMANIVGLVFLGILTNNKDSKLWLKFGLKEFNKAIDFQFYEDGGNFEGSAYYHRLVLEMVLHTLILISNNEDKVKRITGEEKIFNEKTLQKTHNAFLFFKLIITPDKSLFQYGDNDSGRLFNLTGQKDENINKFIINLGDKYFYNQKQKSNISDLFCVKKEKRTQISNFENKIYLDQPTLNGKFFPDSKIYVFKNELYSSLVVLRPTTLGHTHNDLFSFELYAFGKPFIVDGGSYCYTSNPELRNEFRSTVNHNTLWVKDVEQNRFTGPFSIEGTSFPKIHKLDENSIDASHYGFLKEHRRNFKFKKNSIEIIDHFAAESYISLNIAPNIKIVIEDSKIIFKDKEDIINLQLIGISKIEIVEGFYSKQYGQRIKNKRIILKRDSEFSKLNFLIEKK